MIKEHPRLTLAPMSSGYPTGMTWEVDDDQKDMIGFQEYMGSLQ